MIVLKTRISLNYTSPTNLVELFKVSRVWYIAIFKFTILINTNIKSFLKISARGGFYKAIYALRLRFTLCAHLFTLI
jgi:hypothetical protein